MNMEENSETKFVDGEPLTLCMLQTSTLEDNPSELTEIPVTCELKVGKRLMTFSENVFSASSNLGLILESDQSVVPNMGSLFVTTVDAEPEYIRQRNNIKHNNGHNAEHVVCVVQSCNKTQKNFPDEIFFKFPSDSQSCQNWLLACRRNDLIDASEYDEVNKKLFICSSHFVKECFSGRGRKNLKSIAVPTLIDPSNFNCKPLDSDSGSESDESGEGRELPNVETSNSYSSTLGKSHDAVCRLCGNKNEDMVCIFNSPGDEMCIADKINRSLPMIVKMTDHLPKQICNTCVMQLDMCHEFVENCKRTEKMLKACLRDKRFKSQCFKIIKPTFNRNVCEDTKGNIFNEVYHPNYENNESLGNVGYFNNLYTCPLCDNGIMHVSKEKMNFHQVGIPNECTKTEIQEKFCNFGEPEDSDSELRNNVNGITDTLNSENHLSMLNFEANVGARICALCDDTLETLDVCLSHCKMHSYDSKLTCCLCFLDFKNEQELNVHIEMHVVGEKKYMKTGGCKRISCSVCNKKFNNEKTWQEHSCVFTEVKQFRCVECKKLFASNDRLQFHLKYHNSAKQNSCEECEKNFDTESSLYYHYKQVHKGERPFECNTCYKKFYSNARLTSHLRVHTGERPYVCEVCSRSFYDKETLKGHYVTHMSIKPFKCDICNTFLGRKSLLKQHMEVHHSESYISKRVPSLIHYFCKICNMLFTTSYDVLSHRTTHWKANVQLPEQEKLVHICEYCGEKYDSLPHLSRHRKLEHSNEKPYICSICEETSHTLYEARTHRKTHTTIDDVDNLEENSSSEVLVCEECGKLFQGRRRLKVHLRTHKSEKKFQCTYCDKTFPTKRRQVIHERFHSGEKPYSCNTCGRRFTQLSAAHTHSLLHSGIKPHKCDLCGKSFRIKADRDSHRRVHTGERPFKCEFCSKEFRTGQVYYQHRLIHTGERRFPCHYCGKAFKRSHTLVVHKRIHTGEKPNICDICGKAFRQRSDMRKHRKSHQVVVQNIAYISQ